MASNNKKKKKEFSFEEWSNANHGISKEQEEEDARKRQAYLAQQSADIAPVRQDAGERTWFQKSEGNWIQTILGSGTDATEHATGGFLGVGEKVADFGAMLGNAMVQGQLMESASNEMFANAIMGKKDDDVFERYIDIGKEVESGVTDFVNKDLYDEEAVARTIISDPMRKIGIDSERHSVFGEKSDALASSAGQLAGQILFDRITHGGGLALMGATAFGSEAENALRNGADYSEAFLSATISTGAEMLSEKLGGVKFGGKSLTDAAFGELSKKATSKFVKALLSAGKITADASAEGVEEVVSGYMSAWGQKLSYMSDKEIEELFTKEDALESAIGGFVLGGGFSAGEAAVTGRDPASGLTKHEQAVVDKISNDIIASRESDEKKLTEKEKRQIRNSVLERMENGQINIDTIESVLGGDEYKAYRDTVTRENALRQEYEELGGLEKPTLAQQTRYQELHNSRDTFINDDMRNDLRKKLDKTLSPMLKNSKLSESYREDERSRQRFEVDLSKYTGKRRESVERAVNSGVLNNTRGSHTLVELLSEIEATKGITFDYTNNKKLKESGFAIDDKKINGFANKNKGTVTLNVQSDEAWQFVVGHEITHVLEGSESYGELRNALYAYAQSKGELEGRRASLTALYQNMDADIEAELTADLVGDYLFTDKDFVSNLTGNRTLFQKIYDEIKYLWNKATGKEKTEIEKVKDEFDRVWKEFKVKGAKAEVKTETDAQPEASGQNIGAEAEQVTPNADEAQRFMPPIRVDDVSPLPIYSDGEFGSEITEEGLEEIKRWLKKEDSDDGGEDSESYAGDETQMLNPSLRAVELELERDYAEFKRLLEAMESSDSGDSAGVPIEESGKVQYSVSDSASKSGVEYDKKSESYSPIQYSISSWDSSDYVADRKKAAADMAKNLGVTEEQASKYIDDVNSIAKIIAEDKERLSYEPSPDRSAFVSNAEYGGSIDFSTICKKRRLFTGTFEAIQNALPNTALTADEVLEIRKMMKDKGYEVSCGLCYVEGSRTNMGLFTKQFIERYAATNPEYVPNMAEMNTATGQEKIRKEHPEVYEAYEYFMNHYGRLSPTDKALFASQQKPKMYQMSTDYKGEILDKFGGKNRSVAEKNKNGGLRLQSFSDFEIIHLIDCMQVVMDMSRVGLAGQAYTKVPDFAWALGDTGLKINLSLIAKDVDANGRLVLDEVEGMKESDAMALRDRYSDNVGTIVVVFTDAQLKAAMADERIDYIIPYHRSQWKTSQYESMGLPENTQDYTPWQNESYIEDVFNKNGKKLRPDNYMPNTYWDFNKSGTENAKAYLQMCAENNRKPKFSNMLVDNGDGSYSLQPDGSTDGYWKLLIDFKMYNNDGVGVPQNPVVPEFNMEEARRMLNEYTGGHARFPVAKDIVDEFVSKHPDNIAPTPDVQYSISPDTDADYMSAVERGDTETAQRMVNEAAKNAGYTRKLYHGTASKFNVFGFGRTGIFTTDNFDMAKTYGDNVMSLYGKEGANVLHIDAKESPHWSIEVSKDVLDFSEYPLMRGKDRYSTNDISLIAFREGYDVVVIDNVYDNYSAASGNTENGLGTDVVYKDPNQVKSSEAVTYDDNGNVIPLSQRFNEKSDDIRNSLSNEGEEHPIKGGTWRTPFRELAYGDDIAPVNSVVNRTVNETVDTSETPSLADIPVLPDEPIAEEEPVKNVPPMPESDEEIIKTVKERLNAKITNSATELEETKLLRDWVKASYENKIEKLQQTLDSKKNKDTKVAVALRKRIANLKRLSADVDADIQKRISDIESRISKTTERLQDPPKKDILEVRYERIDKQLEEDKIALKEDFDKRKAALWESTQDKPSYISNKALDLYNEVKSMRKGVRVSGELGYLLDNLDLSEEHKSESYKRLRQALIDIKNRPNQTVNQYSEIESIAREMLNSSYEDAVYDLDDMDNQYQEDVKRLEADAEAQKKAIREQAEALHRADVQRQKLDEVNSILHSKGFDLDEMIDNPVRQLSTFETVDTMPQRVMEKTFGYKAGQALADATVNKVAQNESAGLKWLDSITNRKNGLLAQLSKQYNIKPHSKEIAAAMMYGEGSWVNEETGEEFAYGDAELAKDFPDVKVQNNIKALVRDPRIRQFYDETLDAINESRKRNGYPEIPRRANYFLHYRELGDFFTKNGLPFNPNDARAKDLPTDMVGRTADLKPGQPFFTSSWQRKGKKTSYDLFEGMERYANSAKNQIYHIDDIQTLRALHYHLAERFGQAQGLEDLNKLTPEEASEQIKKVYGSHLSTFAAFLDTEANILAGKTSMIDRALSEGMLGRRILTFMDALNQQTGATMVGYNVSSANTNWLPVVREFANSNPVDSVKALAQTVANIASRGRLDSFREDSTVYIRRQGADRFNRKLWQKMQDPAYALMGAVDSISTEIIARTEYNKAIREGMNPQQAHYESDKKVSRLMADRSLGQMPQMYTSRIMGLITKFQLEVRNDIDSMFYDTLQEEKLLRKDIENALERNAKTAAKVAWRYGATAVALHAFGQAFEAVAGYNPAFDIIEAITKAFGWDDDEDDEDTWRDNLGEGAMSLLEDLPYAGIVLDGGRIPISSAIPDLKGMIEGKDEYGNEKTLGDYIKEIAPYMLPAGGNQLKKSIQGLKMFSDEHPVTGSYTDSGSLRFPVEATPLNVAQAAVFGQYASKNAREYFDNEYAPLGEKQIQEYIDVDMPIKDYWEYREGLSDLAPLPGKTSVSLEQKLDYVDGMDLPTRKKNILANNLTDRKEPIDMTSYGDYDSLEEFDYATKNPEKYALAKSVGGYSAYKTYSGELYDIKADKDASGKSITGSRKEKVIEYINNLDADYYTKIILYKSEYPSDDTYNYEIVNHINNRSDMSYDERIALLTELGFRVTADGKIYAD